jgi:hypothetical protein
MREPSDIRNLRDLTQADSDIGIIEKLDQELYAKATIRLVQKEPARSHEQCRWREISVTK